MLKVQSCTTQYISKNGNPVYVHSISGSEAELKNLRANDKLILRENDDKDLICFLSEQYKSGTELRVTRNGLRLFAVKPIANKRIASYVNQAEAMMFLGFNPITGTELVVEQELRSKGANAPRDIHMQVQALVACIYLCCFY